MLSYSCWRVADRECDAMVESPAALGYDALDEKAGALGWVMGHSEGQAHYACPRCANTLFDTHVLQRFNVAVGDWCTWLHVPRGGYGRAWPVDALVKELRGEKAKIEVTLRIGERATRWVKSVKLRRWEQQPGNDIQKAMPEVPE